MELEATASSAEEQAAHLWAIDRYYAERYSQEEMSSFALEQEYLRVLRTSPLHARWMAAEQQYDQQQLYRVSAAAQQQQPQQPPPPLPPPPSWHHPLVDRDGNMDAGPDAMPRSTSKRGFPAPQEPCKRHRA